MANDSDIFLGELEELKIENKELHQQLREARGTIATIRAGNIDALVISNENALRVYTEKTADKIYRILIERMHEGAVTLSEDGTILYCNSYFASMVGLPLQTVIGATFKSFIDESSGLEVDVLIKKSSENTIKSEGRVQTNDGRTVPVLMSLTTLWLDENFVLSIIVTDLTGQKKNQEELKHRTNELEQKNIELESANNDLTSFTYVSSHDLQEPLRKIQNFVACILEEEIQLSETGKGYFGRMSQTARRMQALIDDLLIYSRTKKGDRKFEVTELGMIVDDAKIDFEDIIREKKATIVMTELCETSVIRFQFRQLMHNLISNSLKFSKAQVALRIEISSKTVAGAELHRGDRMLPGGRLSSEIDYCHIIYTDNGIGFEAKYNERIFEVFQRLHSQEEYTGTGMGLAICKRIIENHDGIITASGALGEGARFDIYIPCTR